SGTALRSRGERHPVSQGKMSREFGGSSAIRGWRGNAYQTLSDFTETEMHHFIKASDIRPAPAFPAESAGYRRSSLSDRACGAVHTGWGLCELDAKGSVNQHLQSF